MQMNYINYFIFIFLNKFAIIDLKLTHSSHYVTSDISLAETAKSAELFLSDGVIVTGTSTGVSTNTDHIEGLH